jgi:LysM repeat protein
MSNHNPLQPQGSLLEQNLAGRSRVKWAVICVLGLHLVGLAALLMQGCKRDVPEAEEAQPPVEDSWYTPAPTNMPPMDQAFVQDDSIIPPPVDSGYTSQIPADPVTPTVTPTQTPTQTPAPATSGREYVVVSGDNFYDIGKKFGVTAQAIAQANPNVNPNRLQIGKKLIIPAPASTAPSGNQIQLESGQRTHKVVSGDSLSKIAGDYDTTVKALRSANNLSSDLIKVGQVLIIPAPAQSDPVPPTLPPGGSVPPPSF